MSNIKNGDKPVMPTKGQLNRKKSQVLGYQVGSLDEFQFVGITKREQFAAMAMAMQGLLANSLYENVSTIDLTKESVELADVLLEELEK